MTSKAETAVRGIKDLGGEVSAWEVRLLTIQNECQSLGRQKEQTQKDIESAMTIARNDLEKKRGETHAETTKINEQREKLAADQAEFQGILVAFRKERAEFVDEKDKILALQERTNKLSEKLNNFAYFIRTEAEKI